MITTIRSVAVLSIIILTTGCFRYNASEEVKEAIALIQPASESKVSGVVIFSDVADGVRVQATIKNLNPGHHGFHIHHYGDAYAHDAASVCTHYNPTNQPHGNRTNAKRHMGDMGNIIADHDGIGRLDYVDKQLKLNGPHTIIGRSVIVHENADDYVTQPTGNAGKKIGVGVIGIKNPTTKVTF